MMSKALTEVPQFAPNTEIKVTRKLDDNKVYLTKGYVVVPGKLNDLDFDFSSFTNDDELLSAIALIRQELLSDDGPYRKKNRAYVVSIKTGSKPNG